MLMGTISAAVHQDPFQRDRTKAKAETNQSAPWDFSQKTNKQKKYNSTGKKKPVHTTKKFKFQGENGQFSDKFQSLI